MSIIEEFLLTMITRVYDSLQWPGVVLLMAIESANILPLPSELIMPLSGWMLIQAKGLGVAFVFLAAFYGALGTMLGSWLSYWIGAKYGRPLLERYGKYLLLSMEDLHRIDRWFAKYGEVTVFFTRLIPVVRTFVSYPAGIARMNLIKFSIYTFLGSFLWSLGLAYGGYMLGENWESIRNAMRPFDIPILVIIMGGIAFFLWRRIRALRRQESYRAITQEAESPSTDSDGDDS